jgi:hypothetical protein
MLSGHEQRAYRRAHHEAPQAEVTPGTVIRCGQGK